MQHTYVETWFIFVKMQQMQYNYVKMEPTFQFFLHATQLCQNAT